MKKNINVKKYVLRGINIIICLGGFFLFSIICIVTLGIFSPLFSSGYSSDQISKEEKIAARKIFMSYAKEVEDAVKLYQSEHSNELPDIEEIKKSIDNPHNIYCEKSIINYNGSIFLDECGVDGIQFRFVYGGEILDPMDPNNNTTIYIYKRPKDDNKYYYDAYGFEFDDIDSIDTYQCEEKGCRGISSPTLTDLSPKDANVVIIRDKGSYFFYNVITKDKKEIANLGAIDQIKSISLISNSMGNVEYLYVTNTLGYGAFYNVPTATYTTQFLFNENLTTTELNEADMLAARNYNKEEKMYYITLYSSFTGNYIGTYKDVYNVKTYILEGVNGGYYRYYTLDRLNNGFILRKDFSTGNIVNLVNTQEPYHFIINNDNTFTVLNSDKTSFVTYDLFGNKKYDSSLYTAIDYIYEGNILVRTDKEVLIVRPDGKTVTKFFDITKDGEYGSNRVSIVNIDGHKAYSYAIHKMGSDTGIYYYYVFDTGEIKRKETKEDYKYLVP